MRENQEGLPGKLNGVSSQLIRKDSAGLIDHFAGERRRAAAAAATNRDHRPCMQDGWKKDDGEGTEEKAVGRREGLLCWST